MSGVEPDVSVVIPVYNDPEGIRATLESLRSQVADDHQLVIVDNGSTDRTTDVVRSYADDRITLCRETEIQSSYAARNTGIQRTASDVLAFLDADMTVSDNWLASALDELQAADADYMGCDVELTLPNDPPLPARYDHHTGFPVQRYLDHQHFAPTSCLLVRRDVFEDVGLFDPRLTSGGDKEFGNRVHAAGYDLHFAGNVTVSHPTRNNLRDLIRKDLRVGRGLCQLQRYYPERYGTPGLPPRPSGVKSPDTDLPFGDRLAFGAIGTFLTGVRGLGYYRELVAGDRHPDIDGPPRLG